MNTSMKTNFFVIAFQWFKSAGVNGFGSTSCTASKLVEFLEYRQVMATIEHSLRDPEDPDAEIPRFVLLNVIPMAPVEVEPVKDADGEA